MYFILVILFTSAIPYLEPVLVRCRIPLIPDLLVNKKAFQLNANRPLADRCMAYVVNKFEPVWGDPCTVRGGGQEGWGQGDSLIEQVRTGN